MKQKRAKIELILMVAIIGITVGAVLLISFVKERERKQVRNTLKTYMKCISTNSYEKMSTMIDPDSLGDRTESEYIARNQNIYTGMHVQNLEIKDIVVMRKNQKHFQVNYRTTFDTYAGELSFLNTITLKKKGKKYLIVWEDSLILPGLDENSKVKIRHLRANEARF